MARQKKEAEDSNAQSLKSLTKSSVWDVQENDIIRMLENIFSNCLRYARSRVFYKVFTENNNVVFSISDDGPGIDPEVLEHLFERFAKGSDGKHGIGLALAKSIAEEHQGSIVAYNIKDGGACFEMSIPMTKPKEQLTHANNESANKNED